MNVKKCLCVFAEEVTKKVVEEKVEEYLERKEIKMNSSPILSEDH